MGLGLDPGVKLGSQGMGFCVVEFFLGNAFRRRGQTGVPHWTRWVGGNPLPTAGLKRKRDEEQARGLVSQLSSKGISSRRDDSGVLLCVSHYTAGGRTHFFQFFLSFFSPVDFSISVGKHLDFEKFFIWDPEKVFI